MTDVDLFAVGDNCIDRLTGRTEAVLVGGNALNVAIQASRAGLHTAYAGAVGPEGEADGDRVHRSLLDNGVAADWLDRSEIATPVTELLVADDGDRSIIEENFGACAGWAPPLSTLKTLLMARHVHIGWLDDGGLTRRLLVEAGVSVSQDISVNATDAANIEVDGLTIAFASLPESMADTAETRAKDLINQGAKAAVLTLGREGSLALFDGQTFRGKSEPVGAIDTTGAGDSYIAGFLAGHLKGASIPDSMAAGHARAAQTCTHPGGFSQ